MHSGIVSPSEHDPERNSERGLVVQDDVLFDPIGDRDDELRCIDWIRPRLDDPVTEQRRRPLFFFPLRTPAVDGIV
jgi:hypothetical protein